ncbi:MAG: class I SAM-dependent methyltransferase [Candidatus Thermoplasmatota archaeon]|nr:class I SAM-dependent methyltransferase [Candidatus Thermoplasmatota archaeon]
MRIKPFEEHYDRWFEEHRYAYLSELEAVKCLIPEGKGIGVGMSSGRFAEPPGIKVAQGIAEDLPFEDESFDFVLMVTTICFLDDVKKAFKEAHRVLKRGGSIIIGFIDKESPLGIEYLKHKEESALYRDATFYTVNEVLSFLNGFRVASALQTTFKPLNKIDSIEPVVEGYGKGSFVAIKAIREG